MTTDDLGRAAAAWREDLLQRTLVRHGMTLADIHPVSPELADRLSKDWTLVENILPSGQREVWVEFQGERCSEVMVETLGFEGLTLTLHVAPR